MSKRVTEQSSNCLIYLDGIIREAIKYVQLINRNYLQCPAHSCFVRIKIYVGTAIAGEGERTTSTHYHSTRLTYSKLYDCLDSTTMYSGDMEDDCVKALHLASKFAEEHGLELKIYDVSHDYAAFRAWLDRIKSIPTVIIGKKKLEGVPKVDDLEKAIHIS